MDAQGRIILTKKLAALLEFEDGVDDVLEHLLTIEAQDVSVKHSPASTRHCETRFLVQVSTMVIIKPDDLLLHKCFRFLGNC